MAALIDCPTAVNQRSQLESNPDRLAFIEGLIGRPYRIGARGPDAFDCYGLARYVQHELGGAEMPEDLGQVVVTTRQQAEAMLSHPERRNWVEITEREARDLDLVLMGNVLGRDFHLGTYLKPVTLGGVLHINTPTRDRYGRELTSCVVFDDLPSLRQGGFNFLRFFRRQ